MSGPILRERRGLVELLTINRPEALNALNTEVLVTLNGILDDLQMDKNLRAVVITGAGKAFIAGADISQMSAFNSLEAEKFAQWGQALLNRFSELQVPVIAAVNGFALGGGTELAMACDIIIAGARARFGQPEVKLGVIPGFGGTQRMVRRLGRAQALDLILTGRMIGAQEAWQMGLVSRVVEGDVVEAALAVADEIIANGPTAVRLAKRAIHENADGDLVTGQAAERSLFGLCFASSQQQEGMSAFLNKRKADFQVD